MEISLLESPSLLVQEEKKQSNGKANSSDGKNKKDKKNYGKEKASHYGPSNGVSSTTTVSSVPRELQQMRALLAQMESNHVRSQNVSARRVVTSAEDSD